MTSILPRTLRPCVLALLALLVIATPAAVRASSGGTRPLGTAPVGADALSNPMVVIDAPLGSSFTTSFTVGGWAIDSAAPYDTGLDAVNVYLYPSDSSGNIPAGASAIFSAVASVGIQRTDIAALYGPQFIYAGYSAQVPLQPVGTYVVAVYAHSRLVDSWVSAQKVVQIGTAVSSALINIDAPVAGTISPASFAVSGWAIDNTATADSGIDMVHVYAWPSDAAGNVAGGAAPGTQIFFGPANSGQSRPDVAASYGAQFAASGFNLQLPALADGYYLVQVYAHSSVNGAWGIQSRVVQVASTPVAVPAPVTIGPSQAPIGKSIVQP